MSKIILSILIAFSFVACTKKKPIKTTKDLSPMEKKVTEAIESKITNSYGGEVGFKNALALFPKEKDMTKKYEQCSQINLAKIAPVNEKMISSLSPADTQVMESAIKYCNQIGEELAKYEKSLGAKHRNYIAKDITMSLVPFSKTVFTKIECSDEDYKKIKEKQKVPINYLELNKATMVLNTLYEDRHKQKYSKAFYQLLAQDKSYKYQKQLMGVLKAVNKPKTAAQVAANEQKIARNMKILKEDYGIANPRKYVYVMGRLAPTCLSRVNSKLLNFANHDEINRSGKIFYSEVAGHVKKNKALPKNFDTFIADIHNRIKGVNKPLRRDPWGHSFLLQGNADKFYIISLGKDRRPNTADDVIITVQ